METANEIVQLKVRLLGISPMIWRRVLVPASTTLRELHGILQVAMGWDGIHLFAFDIHAVQYGSFELCAFSPDISLERFELGKNARFSYVYDMNDHWAHEVRIEGFSAVDPKKSYPVCIGGSGACPPEECGGPHGYLECRDEVGSYDAWRDFGVMVEWLDDVIQKNVANLTVRDALTEDAQGAIERIVAREPFVSSKFSRKPVNQAFRDGRHRDLMRQQLA
ncbi:MAG: plasmid pRiA4b ORF-3 family protein [Geminicoccaceae bacterium]|nr:plasmid pRiA4b ORF-3 family protein [Geminicoccaceae bacterium]MCB1970334.1 plasmid pRiA4b ORF-3 family protein [Geminicoccaceae bacterium]